VARSYQSRRARPEQCDAQATTLGSAAGATAHARARSARRMALAFVAVLTLLVLVIALPIIFLDRDAPQTTASADTPSRLHPPSRFSGELVPNDPDPVAPPAQSNESLELRHRCRATADARRDHGAPSRSRRAAREASLRRAEGDRAPAHRAEPKALAAVDDWSRSATRR